MDKSAEYYDNDDIGARYGMPGAGIVGLMLGDQLHPPMINDDKIWSSGESWERGAVQCTLRLANLAEIHEKDHVLDVGSGIGGPAIKLADEYGCKVTGINVSRKHLKTARIRTTNSGLNRLIMHKEGDAQDIPMNDESVSCVWSFNMFYHIPDKMRAIKEFHRVLQTDGRLAFDDWLLTDQANSEDSAVLAHNWTSPFWITEQALGSVVQENGFGIKAWHDYSNVGRGPMSRHFSTTFNRDFREEIAELHPVYGHSMAEQFKSDIEHTIGLYKAGKLTYVQFIAKKE